MADVKISALTAASSLVGTEEFPVVQSGVTKRATGNMLLALANAYADSIVAATDFIGLDDVPADYTGDALKLLRVNAGETGLEFFAAGFDAEDISFDATGLANTTASDVQTALEEIDAAIAAGGGAASGTTFTPAGTIAATNVQDALEELDAETQAAITALGAATDVGIGTYLVSGAAIAWQTGLQYLVGAASYFVDGVAVTSAAQTVTLTAADPTDDRIDVLVLDASGVLDSIDGTASADPAEPSIDPAVYLRLGIVLVGAGTTAPAITQTNIYLENAEWAASASAGTIVANSTAAPRTGTYSVDGTAVAANTFVSFVKPAAGTTDLATQNTLTFYVRVKAAWPSAKALRVAWYSGTALRGTQVSVSNGLFGFNSATTGSYQLITVPISAFAMPVGNLVTTLRITIIGGGANVGFYIDDIVLNSGATTIPSLTASRALVSNVSGNVAASAVTSTELGYVAGVTSGIQAQINALSGGIVTDFTDLADVPSAYTGHTLKVVRVNAGETALEFATASAGLPAGSNTEVQYNNSGAFGASAQFLWNNAYQILTLGTPVVVGTGTSTYVAMHMNKSMLMCGSGDDNLYMSTNSYYEGGTFKSKFNGADSSLLITGTTNILMAMTAPAVAQGATVTYTAKFTVNKDGTVTLTGRADTAASTTTTAGLRIPHGAAPTSPTNGDFWSTTAGFYARVNGSTVGPFSADSIYNAKGDLVVGTGSDTASLLAVGTNGQIPYADSAEATGIRWGDPGSDFTEVWQFAIGDETTAITTGTAKYTFRAPKAITLSGVRASLSTVSSSGIPTVDINVNGSTILSTKLTIDASEKTSVTAATAAVISSAAIADDDEITIDIDVAGTGAAGLKVVLIGTSTDTKEVIQIALSDELTAITTGTAKVTMRVARAMTITAIRANLNTVSSSGIPTVDINKNGSTILSTKLTIDASEKTSVTAATPHVVSDTALADDDELTIDIDVAGTGAKGLKVTIIGTPT